jgi:mRNA (2'-O-methyladenosine-N6-)-methyltransferase
MFANNKFCLEYDTMSNDQIAMLNIKCLSEKGFIFLWILGNQINMACEMMNKWGYDLVDLIIWIKTKRGKIYLSHGYYLMHSYEICLVGYKCPPGQHVEYFSKVSNNVIFGEVTGKSQKPVEIYEIIEMMMPGSKKLEIFARNNNLRKGWFSIGNQLGEEFHQWTNKVDCDSCSKPINIGTKRYKSKKISNFDLCENCLRKQGYDKIDFFEIKNEVADVVLHQYYSCNSCNMNPIWGLRFSCQDCPNIDLCEGCYDNQFKQNVSKNHFKHDTSHNFEIYEMQELSHGFQIHLSEKCASCYQKPITGVCFKCSNCQNLSLCQKCYFNDKGLNVVNRKAHKAEHNWEFFIKPVKKHIKKICSWCEKDNSVRNYSCDICFDFGLCDSCFMKKNHFKVNKATTHKVYHSFTKIEQ